MMKTTLLALCTLLACGGSTVGGLDGGSDSGGGDATSEASSGCDACGGGLQCCNDTCVNETNDPLNCGGCGTKCSGATSMCLGGTCAAPTCNPACSGGQQCCQIDGPGPSGPPQCTPGDTCPVGCPLCK